MFRHRSNGEKRGFRLLMGGEMHHLCDGDTPDPADGPASTGATGRKNPTDQGWALEFGGDGGT